MLFIITGTVRFLDNESTAREFYHQFVISTQGQCWMILSENFRLLR
mgnify:CR=1 FL=1